MSLNEIARIAGHPEFTRRSVFHALNQKATARRHATAVGKKYEELNLVVVHLGGGISIGAHRNGKVVDVNHAIGGEGPFSPERAGSVPVIDAVRLAYSGKYTEKEFTKMLIGQGGLCAHLGTNNAYEVEQRVKNGDQHATLVYEAMAFQVAKFIGTMSVVLKGQVDGILITGVLPTINGSSEKYGNMPAGSGLSLYTPAKTKWKPLHECLEGYPG